MKLNKKHILLIIISLWAVVIGIFIGYYQAIIQNGTSVYFKVLPVDPMDMFRGEYVDLRYPMSELPPNAQSETISEGDIVYVHILPQNPPQETLIGEYTTKKPTTGLFIQGRVTSAGDPIQVKYGIESYFVEQGKGPLIEAQLRDEGTFAHVKISNDGQAVLLDLDETP